MYFLKWFFFIVFLPAAVFAGVEIREGDEEVYYDASDEVCKVSVVKLNGPEFAIIRLPNGENKSVSLNLLNKRITPDADYPIQENALILYQGESGTGLYQVEAVLGEKFVLAQEYDLGGSHPKVISRNVVFHQIDTPSNLVLGKLYLAGKASGVLMGVFSNQVAWLKSIQQKSFFVPVHELTTKMWLNWLEKIAEIEAEFHGL